MGKYMKKSKITGDVGVMEVSQPTSLGVRTRAAKTLALQRLNSSSASASAANPGSSAVASGSTCYLQLRSRRLEKPPLLTEPKKQQQEQHQRQQRPEAVGFKESGSRSRVDSVNSGFAVSDSVPFGRNCDGNGCFGNCDGYAGSEGNSVNNGFSETEEGKEASVEASFGENNNLDFETRDRSTRESTPCNIAGGLNAIVTPGSSTRQRATTATNYRNGQGNTHRIVLPTRELEEFFACAERQQQRVFMEKYNFDVKNDLPLPGRYEWVPVVP